VQMLLQIFVSSFLMTTTTTNSPDLWCECLDFQA
jgi:hypothetical protein